MSVDPTIGVSDPTLGLGSVGQLTQQGAVNDALASTANAQTLTFNNMSDLQTQAPDVYNAVLKSIAWQICSHVGDFDARMRQLSREYSRG